ncbi:MAG: EamA family transporter [Chloroflexi bacterium]|nr:EamA family transporter [Chloroflexota bacterium]
MDKGLVFALLGAAAFAGSTVFIRRGVAWTGESFTAVAISIFLGVPFFAVATSIAGEWHKLWSISGQGFILLATAGIIHFIAGRLLGFNAYRLIGANKSTALLRSGPLYTVVVGVAFLNEPLTSSLIIGVLCISAGATLISTERKSIGEERQGGWLSRREIRGLFSALGAAVFWGISPILIRIVAEDLNAPSVSALVSYVAASIVMAVFFIGRQYRNQLGQLRLPSAIAWLVIGGALVSVAHFFNYSALGHSPASIVAPIMSTSVLFTFLFSFLLNRDIELFTVKVIIGMLATIVGTFFLFYF